MAIIIDGYNLMHVTRFSVGQNDRRRFGEARDSMLAFLDEHLQILGETEVSIVFDSENQGNLPTEYDLGCLKIFFARDYPTADDLIEEMIQATSSPEKLTVVSSDHRLHIAAKRKRATAVDSDVWFDKMLAHVANTADEESNEPSNGDEPETFPNPFPKGYAEDMG